MIKLFVHLLSSISLCIFSVHGQSKKLNFAPLREGANPYVAEGILMDDKGVLVTIALLGADPSKASVISKVGEKISLKLLLHDPVSRVTMLELPKSEREGVGEIKMIGNSMVLEPGDAVITDLSKRDKVSRVVSHVRRHNGKILPLTFVKINSPVGEHKPGTPVFNTEDELVAFLFQKDTNEQSMFALPVEVLTNMKRFVKDGIATYRPCWIGVSMDHLDDAPIIIGVRPDTPAKRAGLMKGDVVLSVGERKVNDYPAVVNAFYYLEADKPIEFKILRGTKLLSLKVTPEVNPLYK